jgi:hypothetical protein
MKTVMSFLMAAFLVCSGGGAAAAGSLGPAGAKLAQELYAQYGFDKPETSNTYVYLVDLVSNAQSAGYGTNFVLTNYDPNVRIHIQGWVIPRGANPDQRKGVSIYLNPYEVQYVNLANYLGDENGFAYLYCVGSDFGAGALLYNLSSSGGLAMTWITPWYGVF